MQNGFVDENSPEGTKVIDKEGKEITFKVTDADHDETVSKLPKLLCYEILIGKYTFS